MSGRRHMASSRTAAGQAGIARHDGPVLKTIPALRYAAAGMTTEFYPLMTFPSSIGKTASLTQGEAE